MEIQNEGRIEMEKEIEKIARELFNDWAGALLTKDPEKVAELYEKDATFLPTMFPKLLIGAEEARGYFEHFLASSPEGKIREEKIRPMGDFYLMHTGLYDFEVGKDGERSVVECRFTFVWHKDQDGKWKIFHHDSAQQPKPGH